MADDRDPVDDTLASLEQLRALVEGLTSVAGVADRFDPSAPLRWLGGRCRVRLLPPMDEPVVHDFVAWCVPGTRGLAICGGFVPEGDVGAMERMLRGALAQYRGAPAEPKGGLVSDDALLLAVAERAAAGEHSVTAGDVGVFHAHAIDMRATMAFELRSPLWWSRPSPAAARFLAAADRLLRARPWTYTHRLQVTIRAEPWPFSIVYTPSDPGALFADGREAVFVIVPREEPLAHDRPLGTDLLVVAMAEEAGIEPEVDARVRAHLAEHGWTDRTRWPFLCVCKDGDIGRTPTDADFELAFAACESVAIVYDEVAKAPQGSVGLRCCLEEVDLTVEMSALWFPEEKAPR